MTCHHRFALAVLLLLGPVAALTVTAVEPAPQSADRPVRTLIIAHRGASGYLPEHTLEAYAYAYAAGADYLEPDVVLAADGTLICSHDLTLEKTTDVADVFPGRARADGKWYAIDFTVAELKQLHRRGPGDAAPRGMQIATLDELFDLIGQLNAQTGRRVGVIPEPKSPSFHREAGRPIEPVLLDALRRHGYTEPNDPAIIQCFDLDALRRIHDDLDSRLRLVYLIGRDPLPSDRISAVAAFCHGLGPNKEFFETHPDMIDAARRSGLALYPYTFKRDVESHRRFIHEHRVRGIFTDFPDLARAVADTPPGGTGAPVRRDDDPHHNHP